MPDEHGTRRSYQRGCNCEPCRQANAVYEAAYRDAYRLSRPPLGAYVDAQVVHQTIAELVEEQWTISQIAAALGYRSPRLQYRERVRLRTWLRIRRLAREWTS